MTLQARDLVVCTSSQIRVFALSMYIKIMFTRFFLNPAFSPHLSSRLSDLGSNNSRCEPPVARAGQHQCLRPGWKILPMRIGYCSNTNGDRRFRCGDNNVAFTNVQLHYYRVRSVEPCHHLGRISQALILSILALGAMRKQQQQQ